MFYTALFALTCLLAKPKEQIPHSINAYPYFKHTSITWTATWSHDDRFIAVGNDNGELAIYETKQWKKLKSWKYQKVTITKLEWNPKQPILAVAGLSHSAEDTIVQLFDMTRMETLTSLPRNVYGRGLSWSPDGEKVAYVGSGGSLNIYSKKGDHLKTLSFKNPRSFFDIDWHPTKNILLAVEADIFLVDIDRDTLLAKYPDGFENKGILSAQWHPGGEFFVTGDYGHENEG